MDSSLPNPDLSIVIVSWNTRELLRDCLLSVFADPTRLRLEVFVADNASSDGSADMVRQSFPQVQLVENAENRGFAAANNAVFPLCRAENILLLNPDTVVISNALRTLTTFLAEHPEAGTVGPKLAYPKLQLRIMDCGFQPTLRRVFNHQSGLARLFPNTSFFRGTFLYPRTHPDQPIEVEWTSGACLLIRSKVIAQVGMLNERWFYSEDVEWCRRIGAAGWKIFCVPTAVVEHDLSASTKQRDDAHILPIAAMRAYFVFVQKPGRFQLLLFDLINLCGILARAVAFRLTSLFDRSRANIWRSRAWNFTRLLYSYAQIAFFDKKIE